jgi:hypothetical protein
MITLSVITLSGFHYMFFFLIINVFLFHYFQNRTLNQNRSYLQTVLTKTELKKPLTSVVQTEREKTKHFFAEILLFLFIGITNFISFGITSKRGIFHFVKNCFVKIHKVDPKKSGWSVLQNCLWCFLPMATKPPIHVGGPRSVRGWKNGLRPEGGLRKVRGLVVSC